MDESRDGFWVPWLGSAGWSMAQNRDCTDGHGHGAPLIRVNSGSIFGWGLIFIFGGLVKFIFYF
jgi:hypothetical protein